MNDKSNSNLWAISPEIQDLKEQLTKGEFALAQTRIKSWLKKNSPRPFERIRLSEYYTWMGMDSQSAKILGPPLSLSEMRTINTAQQCIQLRLAFVLGMMGAKYVALTLMKNIREILSELGEVISHHYPQYFQNYAYLHLSYYLTKEARWGFEQALVLYPEDHYQHFYICLGLCDCDALEGRYQEAINRVQTLLDSGTVQSNKLLHATALQALGEYLNYNKDLDQARVHFDDSLKLFGSDNKSKDFAYLLKHSGLNHIRQSRHEQGVRELEEAKNLLARADQTPTSLIEVLYWINLYSPSSLTLEEKLILVAYPNYSVYSLGAGRQRKSDDTTNPPLWIAKENDKSSEDVWIVTKTQMRGATYQQLDLAGLGHKVIDLNSSLIIGNGVVSSNLSQLQSKLLLALSGGGERGVHQFLLTDYIYQQEFIAWEIGLDRIKKSVRALSRLDLDIALKNLNYIWKRDDYVIILPKDLSPCAWVPYAKKMLTSPFNSSDLALALALSTRSAQRLIKEWRQEDVITSVSGDHSYQWKGF